MPINSISLAQLREALSLLAGFDAYTTAVAFRYEDNGDLLVTVEDERDRVFGIRCPFDLDKRAHIVPVLVEA